MKKAVLAVLAFLLFGSSLVALATGLSDMMLAATIGQSVAASADLVLGLAGIVATGGLLFRRGWARVPLGVWALSATVAAGVATVAWGGGTVGQGALSASGALVFTGLIAWGLVRLASPEPPAEPSEAPSGDAGAEA